MSERDEWHELGAFTPARLALGRAGNGLPTKRVLEFQLAHARARDAVNAPFEARRIADALGTSAALILTTLARDRASYLLNPDAGRRLDASSRAKLQRGRFDAVLVIADGLSSTAIHRHGVALARHILGANSDLNWGPVAVVSGGRVAVGDEIAQALGAELSVVLIGERPGLTAADSVGIYITFAPSPGVTTDAERNCISNVRPGGLELQDAAHRLGWLLSEARRLRLTGVRLKEDAPDLRSIADTDKL
ncbi:MAG TPA: ethanolamine ammonia-lyase subunit EutC [Rhizomicrobium sp.]|jgi:ethanolamine ammonia-lyase small subunit|nr:ethanolamine ammonia-lyase subunit EutC [Rhizomicrobium sp.]